MRVIYLITLVIGAFGMRHTVEVQEYGQLAAEVDQGAVLKQLSDYNTMLVGQVEALKQEIVENNKKVQDLKEHAEEEEEQGEVSEDEVAEDYNDSEELKEDAEEEEEQDMDTSTPFNHKIKWVLKGKKEKRQNGKALSFKGRQAFKADHKPLWDAVKKGGLTVSANGITKGVEVEKGGADGKGLTTSPADVYTAFLQANGITAYKAVGAYVPECGFPAKKSPNAMHHLSWAVWTPACKNKAIRIECEAV